MFPRHDLSLCACTRTCLASEILASMGPSLLLWFLHAKQRLLDQHTSLYGYHTSPVVLCKQNSVISTRITSFNGFQPSSVVLCIQNSDLRTKIACFYGSQTSRVVLCMPYSVICIRITSLYGSQTSCVVFGCKTSTFRLACLAQEQKGSMGSSPHLWFCAFKTATLGPKLHVSMGPRPHVWFSVFKTACLATETLVSMGHSPHVWFMDAKQRLLNWNNKSLWVPDITCRFVHAI